MDFQPSILQIILAFVSFVFLLSGLIRFFKRERSQTFFKVFASTIIWGAILLFALFPELSRSLTSLLGFGENLNTLIFLGFIMVFAILFKIINIIERIERNISEIVRKEALENIETKQ